MTGRVEINLHAEEPTHCIFMHAVAMSIDAISIISSEGSTQQGALFIALLQRQHSHTFAQLTQPQSGRRCRSC